MALWEGEAPAEPELNRTAAQQELRPPVMAHNPGTSSTQAARVAPLPHGRGSWLTAWCVVRHGEVAHVEPGGLHPSPPTPLRCQGRGVLCAISTAA